MFCRAFAYHSVTAQINQIKSNGLLGIAALMLDYNNIEVMCLQLITLRIVSVTSIYTEIQKHEFKTTKINSDKKVQEAITWISRQTTALQKMKYH